MRDGVLSSESGQIGFNRIAYIFSFFPVDVSASLRTSGCFFHLQQDVVQEVRADNSWELAASPTSPPLQLGNGAAKCQGCNTHGPKGGELGRGGVPPLVKPFIRPYEGLILGLS